MDPFTESQLLMNRRHFFGKMAAGLGAAALGSLLGEETLAKNVLGKKFPNFAP